MEDERLERLTRALERLRLEEYVQYVTDRRRMAWNSLLWGLCRGLGFTLGFSVLGAALAALLRGVVAANIPVIGGFLAEIVRAMEARL